MKEITKPLATKMLDEYHKMQQTHFWEYLMDAYEKERTTARERWELSETGSMIEPLFERWIRYQVTARNFGIAKQIPEALRKTLENILKKE